jgi:predicted amidohydrolase YtcJ
MASVIFCHGPILTMEDGPAPQAVLVQDGYIRAVGTLQELTALAPHAQLRDLEGHALLPAFLDPHSHITALAATLGLAQLGPAGSFSQIGAILRDFQQANSIPAGQWVVGFGYDHNVLEEGGHPTRHVLDAALPNHPVLITHASGHMGVVNTAGLKALRISSQTPNPEGGSIGRESDGVTPSGYLEETAFIRTTSVMPAPSLDSSLSALQRAQQVYLSHGITVIQDGLTDQARYQLLSTAGDRGLLTAKVVGYADMKTAPQLVQAPAHGRFSVGGYKIFLDGSPQGRTAWMLEPYLGGEAEYRGYPVYRDEEVVDFCSTALSQGRQLLAHCNGDAAAQQFLDALKTAEERTGCKAAPTRPVMIHAQLLRPEQLPQLKKLGVVPSFFAAHVYYWGEIHQRNFGPDRAALISPLADACRLGLPFTLHQDSPVIQPNMLESIWCAVTRQTRNGQILGPEERISPLEALKGVTIHAARQYSLEEERGSIRPGKVADFVILDADPTAVDPAQLRQISVLETIVQGECVYAAPSDSQGDRT